MSRVHKANNIVVDLRRSVLLCSDSQRIDVNTGLATIARTATALEDAKKMAEALLADARLQSQQILDSAVKDASHIVNSAKQKAEIIMEEAHKQGYNEGYDEGRIIGENEYKKACHGVVETLNAIGHERNNLIDSMEKDVINMVLDVTGKILNYELNRSENAFLIMVKNALSKLRAPGNITLKVHTEQYSKFQKLNDAASQSSDWAEMCIIEDKDLNPGDCLIETGCGTVDIGIATQLRQISEAFRELLPSIK